ncbi:MAG: hypothetical protein JWO86_2284, partial [Myxococcaceae bacterium]|nr:hypothetical protein [Myxococcaceae bacterium]
MLELDARSALEVSAPASPIGDTRSVERPPVDAIHATTHVPSGSCAVTGARGDSGSAVAIFGGENAL